MEIYAGTEDGGRQFTASDFSAGLFRTLQVGIFIALSNFPPCK